MTVENNQKILNLDASLDIILNLKDGTFRPYPNPDDEKQ